MKKIFRYGYSKFRIIGSKFINIFLGIADIFIPKNDKYWIFPVYFIGDGSFNDNMLAVFEKVKDDGTIKKIILTRKTKVEVSGKNIKIVPMQSFYAVWYLLKSKIIFVQHSIWLDLSSAKFQIIKPQSRYIINLWHGMPMKDITHQNTGIINQRSLNEMKKYKIITSSEIDKKNMKKAFYQTKDHDFWITGLPRNDFLVLDKDKLPLSYKMELEKLKNLLGNKKLILYAPTYRETNVNGSYYDFTHQELDTLEEYLIKSNAVLGLRYHIYRKPDCHYEFLKRENIIDLSAEVINDVRLLIRESSFVITDYSSLYFDAVYINKKCISFAYDYEHYLKTQRGFFYDFESIFPGEICLDFNTLMKAMKNAEKPYTEEELNKIKKIQLTLFKYMDDKNSQRVVDRVKALM